MRTIWLAASAALSFMALGACDRLTGTASHGAESMAGYAPLTKAPQGYEVVTAEFKINFLRPALGERFLAIGKVQNAGKLLTVCTGEVRAFVGDESAYDGSRLSALLRRAGVAIGSPVAKPIAKASSKAGLIPCIWLGYVGLTMLDLCASG